MSPLFNPALHRQYCNLNSKAEHGRLHMQPNFKDINIQKYAVTTQELLEQIEVVSQSTALLSSCRRVQGITFRVPIHKVPEQSSESSTLLTGDVKETLEEIERHKLHRPASASEIDALLASATYVGLDFYDGHDKTQTRHIGDFASTAYHFAGTSASQNTCLWGVSRIYLKDEARRYCKDPSVETFIFFKDGKRVAVNGHPEVLASDSEALKTAVEKLDGLAKPSGRKGGDCHLNGSAATVSCCNSNWL